MNTTQPKQWRSIPSFQGKYEASSDGEIRRVGSGHGVKPGRVLAQQEINSNYLVANVWTNNQQYTRLVHRLVYEAFFGPIPEGLEINHKDCNRQNNRPENLEAVTRSENLLHAARTTGKGRGTKNPACKTSEATVRAIRKRHAEGIGYKRLAQEFGITWGLARGIAKRRTWQWLED